MNGPHEVRYLFLFLLGLHLSRVLLIGSDESGAVGFATETRLTTPFLLRDAIVPVIPPPQTLLDIVDHSDQATGLRTGNQW